MHAIIEKMKLNPTVTIGEIIHGILLLGGGIAAYYALYSDQKLLAHDVSRHEQIINHLVESENALVVNQARAIATLEGIEKLLNMRMNRQYQPSANQEKHNE